MVKFIREIGMIILDMEKVNMNMKMDKFMKVNGIIIRIMYMEN